MVINIILLSGILLIFFLIFIWAFSRIFPEKTAPKPQNPPQAFTLEERAWHTANYRAVLDVFTECVQENCSQLGLHRPASSPACMAPPGRQFTRLKSGRILYFYTAQKAVVQSVPSGPKTTKTAYTTVPMEQMIAVLNRSLPSFCQFRGVPIVEILRGQFRRGGQVVFMVGGKNGV